MKIKWICLVGLLMVVACLAACGDDDSSSIVGHPDATAPTVSATSPANAAIGVAINGSVTATFSEAMDAATITAATFTLRQGTTPVTGVVTYSGTIAVFNPTGDLTAGTEYLATITTGAEDLAGNGLDAAKTWSFTTGATADATAPIVNFTNPANAATGVIVNGNVTATFSEAMDPATITTTTFTLKQGTTPVLGAVTYVGTIATFNPTHNLAASTTYTAKITTGATDLAANALAVDKTWSFTTGAATDNTRPSVIFTNPASGAIGVAINGNVTATFSEAMDATTITAVTFTLKHGTTPVAGAVTYLGTVATFDPASNLTASTTYTATITTSVRDLAGNAMAAIKTWSFTTGATAAQGPAPVDLGTAGNFVILAKSGISSTGTTLIVGNIGVSPIDRTAITGNFALSMDPSNVFSTSVLVTGEVFAADYAPPTPTNLTTAVGDMEIAYADAAGRELPTATELGAGNIGGMTLAPGLYKWSTGLIIPTDVTLRGGPNDVWIFQIAQNLTVSNGVHVNLGGGAVAKNIFWQVAGETSLGTTSIVSGNILCQTLIALNTGATLNGRAFAQTAVTLDASAVTQPAQ